jgi:sorting nexin-1/2
LIELGGALSGFGESMFPLASAELNRDLSKHLTIMGDIQKQLHDLHEEQVCFIQPLSCYE